MKRLHVHVSVDDLAQSTRFYPRVNFAISTREGRAAGISHLGI
jgi:hypothetical protein